MFVQEDVTEIKHTAQFTHTVDCLRLYIITISNYSTVSALCGLHPSVGGVDSYQKQ